MIDPVITRLKAEVSDLQGRVEGAAEFAALMQRGSVPQGPVSTFVLPLGLQGGAADASAGLFTQSLRETIAIVLVLNAVDGMGAKVLARLDQLVKQIIEAVAGWDPEDAVGVFEFVRGNLITPGTGRIAYQLEFAINDQLRITP